MGVFFTQLAKKDYVPEAIQMEQSMSGFVAEHYSETATEYNTILIESLQAAYIGAKDNAPKIVTEGASDVVESIITWFKKWLKKFKDFIVSLLKKMYNFFFKGDELAKNYEKDPKPFKEFEVEGYKYTITTSNLPKKALDDYFGLVTTNLYKIAKADNQALGATYATAKSEVSGEVILDKIRGLMIGESSVPSTDYTKKLNAHFRNDSTVKSRILCDRNEIVSMCKKNHELKNILDSCDKNRKEMEENVKAIVNFIHGQKAFYSSSQAADHANKLIKEANPKGVTSKDIAISQYFTVVNQTVRQMHQIYDLYYAKKVDATKEAMKFYLTQITKAQKLSRGGILP